MPIAFKKPEKKAKRAERPHKNSPPASPDKRLKTLAPPKAGKGGIIPPAEHQWQPGQSGNPAGRPRAITGHYAKYLSEMVERPVFKSVLKEDANGKKKWVEEIVGTETVERGRVLAEAMYGTACSSHRNNVQAAVEMRKATETDLDEQSAFGDKELIKMFLRTLMERQVKVKHANVLEIA